MTNSQKQYDINIFKRDLVDNASEGKGFTQSDNELKEKVVTIDQTIAKKRSKVTRLARRYL